MLCSECGKNPATIHIVTVFGDTKKGENLCQECWQKRNAKILGGLNLNVGELLSQLLSGGTPTPQEDKVELSCASCGMTYEEFRKTGRLGCAKCYEAFGQQLRDTLKSVHGHARHVGRVPESLENELRTQRALQEARNMMEEAVKAEEFEKAAFLRDKIRALENEIELKNAAPVPEAKEELTDD